MIRPRLSHLVTHAEIHRTGAIYGLQAPTSIPVAPVGDWNTYLIEATGPRIRVTLNGQLINDFTSNRRPVAFRDLRVKT
jgi:hypothetical protein